MEVSFLIQVSFGKKFFTQRVVFLPSWCISTEFDLRAQLNCMYFFVPEPFLSSQFLFWDMMEKITQVGMRKINSPLVITAGFKWFKPTHWTLLIYLFFLLEGCMMLQISSGPESLWEQTTQLLQTTKKSFSSWDHCARTQFTAPSQHDVNNIIHSSQWCTACFCIYKNA